MNISNVSPLSNLEAELKPLFSNEHMLAFFKKFCDAITSSRWGFKIGKNAKYKAEDFLRVFFYSEIVGRSIHDASERLNMFYLSKKKGRHKVHANGYKAREVPHQTEVNNYLRRIGLKNARRVLRECLDHQLLEALDLGLLSKKVNVLIDFTEHGYYGKRKDKMIKGTIRVKGTKKMRHYLVFSLLSPPLHLFAGLEHVAKGQHKVPIIISFLEHLIDLGFEINYVLIDREFYNAELLEEIKELKGDVLIPTKSYQKIKQIIKEYLEGTGKRVRRYLFSSAPGKEPQVLQNVYLILSAKKGYSLLSVKRQVQKGKLSLRDGMKLLYAIMTTQKPKGGNSSWATRTARFYKKRWYIETGFSDLNRMGRRWKSHHDNTRYLDMLVRMLLYNSWKINRAWLKKCSSGKRRSPTWTLQNNRDSLEHVFLEA